MREARGPSGPGRKQITRSKLWLFRLAALLLPLLIMESAARLYWGLAVEQPKAAETLFEELIGDQALRDEAPYLFPPRRQFQVGATPTVTNNVRTRNSYDIDLDRTYTGLRILCVGDSVTFGYSASNNEAAYPAQLERLLRQQHVRCQVLNAGMPRYRIEHVARYFRDNLHQLDADVVVVLGGWNNINDHILRPQEGNGWRELLDRHWYLLKVVRHWRILPQWSSQRRPAQVDPVGYETYRTAVRSLVEAIRQDDAKPVLCTLPHFFDQVSDRATRDKATEFAPAGTIEQLGQVTGQVNRILRQLAAEEQVILVDLTSINQPRWFADAIHPNDEGSLRIAQLVMESLEEARNSP